MKTFFANPFICLLAIALIVCSCSNYDPVKYLNSEQQQALAVKIAAYTEKKPKHFSYTDRFSAENKAYYKDLTERINYKFLRFYREDSLNYFLIVKDESSSEKAVKRGVGGIFTMNNDSITSMDIEFVTPVLLAEEVEYKSSELFRSMVSRELKEYQGNMSYIEWPNQDVVYDKHSNRWVFPEGSRYKVFENVMTNQR